MRTEGGNVTGLAMRERGKSLSSGGEGRQGQFLSAAMEMILCH